MQPLELVDRIYDHVEAREIDKAVIACLRLARSVNDTVNVMMFLRELHPDTPQFHLALRDETQHLSEEARSQLKKVTLERWMHERTPTVYRNPEDDDRNVFGMSVGDLQHEMVRMEQSIADLTLPPGLGEYDTAAFHDRFITLKQTMRVKMAACNEILERIRTRCLYYATRLEAQLKAEAHTSDILGNVQRDVHNYYAEQCEPVFQSLRKAASLLGSEDPEDHALLLTSVRRAVKAAADYHYPAQSGAVTCADGKIRELGDDAYLNRLHEFCRSFDKGASTDLLVAEFEALATFVRRLNDVASKGVHAQVSPLEARQGLFGLYMCLSNIIAKLTLPAAAS